MKKTLLTLLFSFTNFAAILTLPSGRVITNSSLNGFKIKNIRFAKPPTGNLRWKAPQELLDSKLIINNPLKEIKCAQNGNFFSGDEYSKFSKPVGSEDCLVLNIWTPTKNLNQKLPVVVWMHGGSNRAGYAADELYEASALSQKTNSIIVSFNYRLGFLGAFYSEYFQDENELDRSGNFVTLDSIAALKWVHKNIKTLGGDPQNITIAGESAGCINVWGLIQTPLAKDLFKKAYCSSGFPNNYPTVIANETSKSFIKQALVKKGYAKDIKEASNKIKKLSKEEIKRVLYSLSTKELLEIPLTGFPVQHISDGHVFSSLGMLNLALGNFNKVDIMTGSNTNEGSYFNQFSFLDVGMKEYWEMVNAKAATTPIDELIYGNEYTKFKSVSKSFTKTASELMDYVLNIVQFNSGNIFRYKFDWKPIKEPWRSLYGPTHGIELPFMFAKFEFTGDHFLNFLSDDLKEVRPHELSNEYLTYLKGFFHTGNPNEYIADDFVVWNKWSTKNLKPFNMIFGEEKNSHKYVFPNPLINLDILNMTQSILLRGLDLHPKEKDSI